MIIPFDDTTDLTWHCKDPICHDLNNQYLKLNIQNYDLNSKVDFLICALKKLRLSGSDNNRYIDSVIINATGGV